MEVHKDFVHVLDLVVYIVGEENYIVYVDQKGVPFLLFWYNIEHTLEAGRGVDNAEMLANAFKKVE